MHPDLDHRLTESAPQFATSSEVESAVAELVADARSTRQPRRLGRRGVSLGIATTTVVLAGSAAAAAALTVGGWTAPWASDPDGSVEFQLPSGTPCELRIGNVDATEPGLSNEIRAWLDDHTLSEIADVDSALRELRGPGNTWVRNDGTEVEVGYGTKYYDADAEYFQAVQQAVFNAINDKAEKIGLPKSFIRLSHEAEVRCEGKEAPSIPSWMR